MPNFQPGDAVAVPASVQQGAFPGEYLITIQTTSGAVSGFVRDQDFVENQKTIRGIVRESTATLLAIQLLGSYFTTNGLAEFDSNWAKTNIKIPA